MTKKPLKLKAKHIRGKKLPLKGAKKMVLKELKLYKPEEVAELLGYSKKTIRRWLQQGTLPGVKVHTEWRIREDDLINFLKENEVI